MAVVRRVVPVMRAGGNLQWDDSYPDEQVFLRDMDLDQLWISEDQGRITGVAAITTDQEPEYAEVSWDTAELAVVVYRLAVDPDFSRKGVAMVLMRQAETVALERRIPLLRLDTNSENEATQRPFPKLGHFFAGEIGLGFRPGLRLRWYEKRLS